MEQKHIIEILNKYNLNEQDRAALLSMLDDYQKVRKKLNGDRIKRAAAWLILKKIWDYLEEQCT
jgi:NADH:ubiquinone oxidoreductase subunit E